MVAGVGAAPPSERSYRVDIDGLRAISIVLVVAFHAGIPQFAGGYVGVDVFFVLSGYLITGLLVAEFRRDGRISLLEFYARRIRRLLPLASVVLVTTLIVGLWLLAPLSRSNLLYDARAAALYFANWRFANQATAYSDAQVTDSLLLHYWSLSVEEQFYVVWPVLVVAVVWFVGRRRRRELFVPALGAVLSVVVAASLLASVTITAQRGPEAYYLSHTRFWEMGIGAGLALLLPRMTKLPRWAAEAGGIVGLGMILVAATTYSALTAFPGWTALLPVAGTSLMIATAAHQDTFIARALRSGPLPYVGRISYGWYLWHWPVIGIALLLNVRQDSPWPTSVAVTAAIGCSFLLAAVSHVVVENPLRHAAWLTSSRRRSYVLGGVATAAPVVVVVMFLGFGDTGDRTPVVASGPDPSDAAVSLTMSPKEASDDDITVGPAGCHTGQRDPVPNMDCIVGDPTGDTTVVLVGDSHARHWLPALDRAATERGWRVISLTKSACTPIAVGTWSYNLEREYTECADWRAAVFDELAEDGDIDLTVVARSYDYTRHVLDDDGQRTSGDEVYDLWSQGAATTFENLLVASDTVLVLRDTPWASDDVPTCFSTSPTDSGQCALSLDEHGGLDDALVNAEQRVAPQGVVFADPTPLVCPDDPCPMVTTDGLIKYSDRHHLTQAFSRKLGPDFGAMLDEVIDGSSQQIR